MSLDREEFESLNATEQEKRFHQAPLKERGELLRYCHEPVRLTQSLSREELYLLTKEMDQEDRSEIIRYANLPQLFFISDIDCWKKDRMDAGSFLRWMETLAQADEKRFLAWLSEMDYETVVTGLKKLIRVLKPEWEYAVDEVLADTPYFTLDSFYYIAVTEENLETVRRAMEILYEKHRGRYVALLEGVIAELDDELEEEAYLKRGVRLAERGFPDFESAHSIYHALDRAGFDAFPKKAAGPHPAEAPHAAQSPNYLALWKATHNYFDEVLLHLRDENPGALDRIQEELAWLSNKVIASNGIDFSSEERVRMGVERARATVSLGLEILSDGDRAKAAGILQERWLEAVFRFAVGEIYAVRDQAAGAVKNFWKGSRADFLQFLDMPYEAVFQGILKTFPQVHDPQANADLHGLRDFQTVQDLERTALSVRQIEKLLRLLAVRLRPFWAAIAKLAGDLEETVSLFTVLGTGFAKYIVSGKFEWGPLSRRETNEFLQKAFEPQGSRRVIKSGLKASFLHDVMRAGEADLLRPLWALVFERIEEELGKVSSAEKLDAAYLSALKISAGAPVRAKKPARTLKKGIKRNGKT